MFELPDLSRGLKYYNLFTYIVKRYFQGYYTLTLIETYHQNNKQAEANGESGTWWDIFDGTMWICTFVAVQITAGYIKAVM